MSDDAKMSGFTSAVRTRAHHLTILGLRACYLIPASPSAQHAVATIWSYCMLLVLMHRASPTQGTKVNQQSSLRCT